MSEALHHIPDPDELSAGQRHAGQFVPGAVQVEYRCTGNVRRRIWSLTGAGEIVSPGISASRIFLKQFINRGGRPDRRGFDQELASHEPAEKLLSACVRLPKLLLVDAESLILGYEFIECLTFDELLRQDEKLFRREFDAVLPHLVAMLDALAGRISHAESHEGLHPGAASIRATVFPGLELRNMGVLKDAAGDSDSRLCTFDLGRPYEGCVADTTSALLLSIGLLNWGRPLRRFLMGPDFELLDQAWHILGPFADLENVVARFEQEEVARAGRIKAANNFESVAKKIGIRIVGRRYLRALTKYAGNLARRSP